MNQATELLDNLITEVKNLTNIIKTISIDLNKKQIKL